MKRISLDLSNVTSGGLIPQDFVHLERPALDGSFERLKSEAGAGETGYMTLPTRDNKDVHELAASFGGMGVKDLVVLGIGGSALGTRAITEALLHPGWNALPPGKRGGRPRVHVLENIDPFVFTSVLAAIDLNTTVFNVVSKSGKTAETAAQFLIVAGALRAKLGKGWKERVVITTDPDAGPMRELCESEGIASLPVPPTVGGRFSVLSPVSMFPAALLGVDIDALASGASLMARRCLDSVPDQNPALLLSAYYRETFFMGLRTTVLMPYTERLRAFGLWFSQLWAESLGKRDAAGRPWGLTPALAMGATDQHSQLQLYLDGPLDKSFTLIRLEDHGGTDAPIPGSLDHKELSYLHGSTLQELLAAEFTATREALAEHGRQSLTLSLSELCPETLGGLFMLFEMVTTLTGYMMGVNPFDQPAVELGKRIARRILEEGGAASGPARSAVDVDLEA